MTVPRSVAEVLEGHVVFELECIDRMYLNLYQPKLMYTAGVVGFFKYHRDMPFVSGALMDPISKDFVAAIHRFIADHDLDLVHFAKGQRKDDVAKAYLADHDGSEGVLFVGRAQEKASVFRTERRVNPTTGKAYPWLVPATSMVNHFYFYAFDDDFGPFFLKFGTYFPYTAKVCLNGHHWAQRQAERAGIDFEAMDNAFAACSDPEALQRICAGLSPARIEAFCRKWLRLLPHPFSAEDRGAGYRYDISVLQAEFSLTQMLDRPLAGRVFFEEVIRENLDAGRPDQVSLTFDRRIRSKGKRPTPGRFRTRVITEGVIPSVHLDYKRSRSTSRRTGRCAPSAPSTTPATSASANGCTTSRLSGRSAFLPTDACSASNEPAVIRVPEPLPTTRCAGPWSSRASVSPPFASTIPLPRRCSWPWWCCVSCPKASPTATCESTSPRYSAASRAP